MRSSAGQAAHSCPDSSQLHACCVRSASLAAAAFVAAVAVAAAAVEGGPRCCTAAGCAQLPWLLHDLVGSEAGHWGAAPLPVALQQDVGECADIQHA